MSKTHRNQFDDAMQCNTKEEADEWLKKEIDTYAEYGKTPDEAKEIILSNLYYMAAYCSSHEILQKVHHLFGMTFKTSDQDSEGI